MLQTISDTRRLTNAQASAAASYWRQGRDTAWIAEVLKAPEHAVYNTLALLRGNFDLHQLAASRPAD